MGGSGSRSAQELHRSPPCTRLQCLDTTRRQPRMAVGLPKCRHGLPKAPPRQQSRGLPVQKNAALRKGEVAVGRLRAGCETFRGCGDVTWPTAQVAGVKAQEDPAKHRAIQRGDSPIRWKAGSGVGSDMAQLTAVKQQRVDRPAPLRPRSAGQLEAPPAARKTAVGYVVERWPAAAWPPPPPPEPPPPAAAHRPDAGPQQRDVSASYAGSSSSTSSQSSLAHHDSGISSSPSRVSLQNHHDDCEEEMVPKLQSPRPPAWKVRGFREDQIPNDLHRRFCEEIKSSYQLQTEEDRRRRLLAIRRIDSMLSERKAFSVGREILPPHCSLRRRPKRFWAASGNKGGDKSNSSELRGRLRSSAAEGKSGNIEGRKLAHNGRDGITARRPQLDRYPKYVLTTSCRDTLQQEAEENHCRSLNEAVTRQNSENYSLENSHEQERIVDIFARKLTVKTGKDDAHELNSCLKQIKERKKYKGTGDMPNEWGNARGETESINRTLETSQFQRMFGRNERYEQNEKESTIVDDWYSEGLDRREETESHNVLLQAGQWNQNGMTNRGTETPRREPQQSDSRNAEEGVTAQKCAASDTGGSALLGRDNVVMQLLLGGYFRHEHFEPCWPRVGAVRRTTNQLDVSIRSCREPVEKQSVETQTPPVHVSRRLPHPEEPRLPLAPKIEIDHRGGLTRYYGLGRECSVGSLQSSGTPGTPRRPPTAADARPADEERMPSYVVPQRPPPPPPPPSCASQRSHSERSSPAGGPSAQWISPDRALLASRNNRQASMPQPLATHVSGNSARFGLRRGFTLEPETEVDNGSHYRNAFSKPTVSSNSTDQSKEDYETEENDQGEKSVWSGNIFPVSHSTVHKPMNEERIKTDNLFSRKKYNAENTNVSHRHAISDRRPLMSEEELGYSSVNMSKEYSRRVSVDNPPSDFSFVSEVRSMHYSTPNAQGDDLHHSVEHWGEEKTKQKPERGTEKTRRRYASRHPRHSRHHRNSSRRKKREENFAESDSGSEERSIQRNIGLQSLHRVIEETELSNSCRGKDSFDTLDNVLLGNVRSDSKVDGKSQYRHDDGSRRIEDEGEEETSDDAHLLIGSTEQSSDSITKSSMPLLCHCCREHAQDTSFGQCKFIPDRKKLEKRDGRRSVCQSRRCVTQNTPSPPVVRSADSRVKQGSPYDVQGEETAHCRSSCCCTCHKALRQPRFQADVSGRQAAHVGASDTPCCCREQRSVECSACRWNRGDGPAPDGRSFHECYCGSRRVCYSILEDEEEAAAAEEAQPGCYHSHAADDWPQ